MHNLNQVKILNNDHEAELLKVLALMVGFQSELNTMYLDNFLSHWGKITRIEKNATKRWTNSFNCIPLVQFVSDQGLLMQ